MKKLLLSALLLVNAITTNAQNYPDLIKVPGGSFTMGDEWGLGDDNEQPTHQVTLTDYFIGKTEVTVAQYRSYCNATGVSMPDEPSWGWHNNDPIVNVSWHDAIHYCDWLSEKLDKNILLPTEAQWEYAARGGSNSRGYKYSGGPSMAVGWYQDNSGTKVHPVATKKANELGLYNMSGNVREWCLNWYAYDYYKNSLNTNQKDIAQGDNSYRALRGGDYASKEINCRVANRDGEWPTERSNYNGFRVVSF